MKTVLFGKRCFSPLPGFGENGEHDDAILYPQNQGVLILRPWKTTKMTGVTQELIFITATDKNTVTGKNSPQGFSMIFGNYRVTGINRQEASIT